MALPQVLVNFKGVVGAKTPLNVATMALNASSLVDTHASPHGRSVFSHFKRESASFAVTRGGGDVVAFCAEGDVAVARELMVDPVVAVLDTVSESFLVEIREDWLFAYGFCGDVSTTDPKVWAWVFAVASRLVDAAEVWRRTAAGGATWPREAMPFYTARSVERPRSLDGFFDSRPFERLGRLSRSGRSGRSGRRSER